MKPKKETNNCLNKTEQLVSGTASSEPSLPPFVRQPGGELKETRTGVVLVPVTTIPPELLKPYAQLNEEEQGRARILAGKRLENVINAKVCSTESYKRLDHAERKTVRTLVRLQMDKKVEKKAQALFESESEQATGRPARSSVMELTQVEAGQSSFNFKNSENEKCIPHFDEKLKYRYTPEGLLVQTYRDHKKNTEKLDEIVNNLEKITEIFLSFKNISEFIFYLTNLCPSLVAIVVDISLSVGYIFIYSISFSFKKNNKNIEYFLFYVLGRNLKIICGSTGLLVICFIISNIIKKRNIFSKPMFYHNLKNKIIQI